MIRRDFIKSTALCGVGLALGLSGIAQVNPLKRFAGTRSLVDKSRGFTYPRGGCTESGLALFDKGPCGRDPFRFDT